MKRNNALQLFCSPVHLTRVFWMMFLKMLLIPSVGVSLIFELERKVFLISTIHGNDAWILLLKYSYNQKFLLFLFPLPVLIKGHIGKSTFISDYKNEPKFHVSGKLGGKIASEFGIDASAIDSFTISMDVGTVLKREVTWDNLKKVLADTTLNLDHEYVQYILAKQRRSLCVIYETVATKGDTDLDSDSKEEGLTVFCFIDITTVMKCCFMKYTWSLLFLVLLLERKEKKINESKCRIYWKGWSLHAGLNTGFNLSTLTVATLSIFPVLFSVYFRRSL